MTHNLSARLMRYSIESATEYAAPTRKRRRKPSRVAPVFHVAGYVSAALVTAWWLI